MTTVRKVAHRHCGPAPWDGPCQGDGEQQLGHWRFMWSSRRLPNPTQVRENVLSARGGRQVGPLRAGANSSVGSLTFRAGSDDPQEQAKVIPQESEERTEHPDPGASSQ